MATNQGPMSLMLLGTANADGTFTGVATVNTKSIYILPGQCDEAAIAIIGNGTIASGAVDIEEAFWDPERQAPYSGLWSLIERVTASTLTGNAQYCKHLPKTALFAYRVQISTAIAGGGGISAAVRQM